MITTIIITALATLILTFLVGYFIWSIRGLRKLKKQAKDNSREIDYNRDEFRNIEEQIHKRMSEISDEIYENINQNDERTNKEFNEIYDYIEKVKLENQKELDTRFNRVHDKIGEIWNKIGELIPRINNKKDKKK